LLKKGKICKEVLNIHNEIKFITFDESTLALWDKEISNHFQGELHDLKIHPLRKFKKNKLWRYNMNGI
jgi:hypothetical protein